MRNSEFKIQDDKKSITSVDKMKSREDMNDEQFNDFMKLSIEQSENGESVTVDQVFDKLLKK